MAGASSNLTFRLFGKDVSASKAFRGLEKNASSTSKRFAGLGSAMATVGAIAGTVAVAAAAVGSALYDAAQAAAQDQKSSAALDKTLRSVTKSTQAQVAATEAWVDQTQRAVGVADDQLRPALAQLVRVTGDVQASQKLLSLALDVSAGTGRDLQSVTVALGRAYNGNVSGLSRLGVAVKDTHGKTLSYSQVVDSLSKQFAGQASTAANTYEGKMARLGIAFDEFKESIGYKVLPVLESFADWMSTTGMPMLERMTAALEEYLAPAIENVRNSFADMSRTVRENQQFFDDLATVAIPVLKVAFATLGTQIRGAAVVLAGFARAGSAIDSWARGVAAAIERATGSIVSMVMTFKYAFNQLSDSWNRTFGSMSFDLPGPLGGGHVGFPRMPHLANGGIVTRPTVALVGESGPEAVVPLSRVGYGGVSIYITQPLGTPEQIARAVNDALRRGASSGRANIKYA